MKLKFIIFIASTLILSYLFINFASAAASRPINLITDQFQRCGTARLSWDPSFGSDVRYQLQVTDGTTGVYTPYDMGTSTAKTITTTNGHSYSWKVLAWENGYGYLAVSSDAQWFAATCTCSAGCTGCNKYRNEDCSITDGGGLCCASPTYCSCIGAKNTCGFCDLNCGSDLSCVNKYPGTNGCDMSCHASPTCTARCTACGQYQRADCITETTTTAAALCCASPTSTCACVGRTNGCGICSTGCGSDLFCDTKLPNTGGCDINCKTLQSCVSGCIGCRQYRKSDCTIDSTKSGLCLGHDACCNDGTCQSASPVSETADNCPKDCCSGNLDKNGLCRIACNSANSPLCEGKAVGTSNCNAACQVYTSCPVGCNSCGVYKNADCTTDSTKSASCLTLAACCGDKSCQSLAGENPSTCPGDCLAICNPSCSTNQYCDVNVCRNLCTENDAGKDYLKAGATIAQLPGGATDTKLDSCSGNVLTEYFCDAANPKQISSIDYTCPGTCTYGKCDAVSSDTTPPKIVSAVPQGFVPFTTTPSVTIQTDENAVCKINPTTDISNPSNDIPFSSMTIVMKSDTLIGGKNHAYAMPSLVAGNRYQYFIRCIDAFGNELKPGYKVSFYVDTGATCTDSDILNDKSYVGTCTTKGVTTSDICNPSSGQLVQYYCSSQGLCIPTPDQFCQYGCVGGLTGGRCADPPIGVTPPADLSPPKIIGKVPVDGFVPAVPNWQIVSITTKDAATCRYATTKGVSFLAMSGILQPDAANLVHYTIVAKDIGKINYYYFKCQDLQNPSRVITDDNNWLSFYVDLPPTCSDNDLLNDRYKVGTCQIGSVITTDKCDSSNSNNLLQYICGTSSCDPLVTVCPYGCTNGVCAPNPDELPPVISNPQPGGTIAEGLGDSTYISVITDKFATCRYAPSDVDYDSMTTSMTADSGSGGRVHKASILLSDSFTYNYWVRCKGVNGIQTPTATKITFTTSKKNLCTDTDILNFPDYYGVCYAGDKPYYDSCISQKILRQYSCQNNMCVEGVNYVCPYACDKNRCVSAPSDNTAAVISNPIPKDPFTGSVAVLGVTTNEPALCRFGISTDNQYADKNFEDLPVVFDSDTPIGGVTHTRKWPALIAGKKYYVSVRCIDGNGIKNTVSYTYSFNIAAASSTCSDTDVLNDYLLVGSCTPGTSAKTPGFDRCDANGNLIQTNCDSTTSACVDSTPYTCPGGCSLGKCLPVTSCSDTDVLNDPNVAGNCNSGGKNYADGCDFSGNQAQFSCVGSACAPVITQCQYGCSGIKCNIAPPPPPPDPLAPVISIPSPIDSLPSGTTNPVISINTNVPAWCKLSAVDEPFENMPVAFPLVVPPSVDSTNARLIVEEVMRNPYHVPIEHALGIAMIESGQTLLNNPSNGGMFQVTGNCGSSATDINQVITCGIDTIVGKCDYFKSLADSLDHKQCDQSAYGYSFPCKGVTYYKWDAAARLYNGALRECSISSDPSVAEFQNNYVDYVHKYASGFFSTTHSMTAPDTFKDGDAKTYYAKCVGASGTVGPIQKIDVKVQLPKPCDPIACGIMQGTCQNNKCVTADGCVPSDCNAMGGLQCCPGYPGCFGKCPTNVVPVDSRTIIHGKVDCIKRVISWDQSPTPGVLYTVFQGTDANFANQVTYDAGKYLTASFNEFPGKTYYYKIWAYIPGEELYGKMSIQLGYVASCNPYDFNVKAGNCYDLDVLISGIGGQTGHLIEIAEDAGFTVNKVVHDIPSGSFDKTQQLSAFVMKPSKTYYTRVQGYINYLGHIYISEPTDSIMAKVSDTCDIVLPNINILNNNNICTPEGNTKTTVESSLITGYPKTDITYRVIYSTKGDPDIASNLEGGTNPVYATDSSSIKIDVPTLSSKTYYMRVVANYVPFAVHKVSDMITVNTKTGCVPTVQGGVLTLIPSSACGLQFQIQTDKSKPLPDTYTLIWSKGQYFSETCKTTCNAAGYKALDGFTSMFFLFSKEMGINLGVDYYFELYNNYKNVPSFPSTQLIASVGC